MLSRLKIERFKSLENLDVTFPRLTVLFGPNAAGKSNLLEAVQILSRIGTSRTLAEAFAGPVRGYPLEEFTFHRGGLPELVRLPSAQFLLEAIVDCHQELYRYRVGVQIQPGSGSLSVQDEYLARLNKSLEPKGNPSIERVEGQLRIRRKSKPAHPREEHIGLNHTLLSDPRLSGDEYRSIERCRSEFEGWRIYYLDPRTAMRSARPPADVRDIGVLGEDVAPYLYRLKGEEPRCFDAVRRALRSLIPSIEDLHVDLDEKRGTLDIQVRQDGIDYSSRIISEGTLRVLALCAIAVNPWTKGLIAFEEPENGVHPRRLELIAQLLTSLAMQQGRQVIVTTHSALFCDAVLKQARPWLGDVSLLNVRRGRQGTTATPFESAESLFKDQELTESLTAPREDGLFEELLLRGLIDE